MNTTVEYIVGDDVSKVMNNSIYEFYRGKVDFTGPDSGRVIDVATGIGGMMNMNKAIQEMTVRSGLVVNASDVGKVGKDDEGYTSYIIPFLANVRFKIDSKFDPIEVEGNTNPWINGFRQSSYNYCVIDKESGDTIDIIAIKNTRWNKFKRYIKKLFKIK